MAKGKPQAICHIRESIAQHITMLITTRFGEVEGNPDFGSLIWDLEFDQLVRISDWETRVKDSIAQVVNQHEKRITDIETTVQLSEIDDTEKTTGITRVKRKANIRIYAYCTATESSFYTELSLYISPLSM